MGSAIGWYGPLIDLSRAASHTGDFVQLLVFVHRCSPVQYKLSKGGEVVRTDIQVGDETRPFFSVSLWQKQMGSMAVAGDIVLLQNVKITSFGGIVEARTVQHSSLRCLIHPFESLVSKGVDELIGHCEVGFTMKEKLRKVVEWAKQAGSTIRRVKLPNPQVGQQLAINWNVPEERKSWNCLSLLEVLRLTNSCKAIFYASVGEIFLPLNDRALGEVDKEYMFIRRRLSLTGDANVVEDFICTGCQLCGSPLDSEHGSRLDQNCVPLICHKSTNRLHAVGLIYRPFMLYVWDELEYIPLLVTNKAAELLFGNIRAERVYSCHERQPGEDRNAASEGNAGSCSSDADKSLELGKKHKCSRNMKFDLIWLILLRMLLQQGKNSPLKFEVDVNPSLDMENGRFEMVSMSLPCCRTQVSPD